MANRIFEKLRKNAVPPQEAQLPEEEAAAIAEAETGTAPEAPEQETPDEEAQARRREDVELLLSLFPKLSASAVPEEVWDRVREGDSLSAAYCLWLVKTVKEKKRIDGVNEKNRLGAIPPVNDDSSPREGSFTRDTVRNMTREQIRKNLDGILRSMDSWK